MENLQNEVAALLEKCAKFKVGQTVYTAYDKDSKCSYGKAVVTNITLDYDTYFDKYSIWYRLKGDDEHEWSEEECDLAATSEELVNDMVEYYTQKVENWKNAVDWKGYD